MTPSHTVRRGRRYRYYASKDRIGEETRETWRVSATELERVVLDGLIRAIERAIVASSAIATVGPDELLGMQAAARTTIDTLRGWPSSESRRILRATVANVYVRLGEIAICGSLSALKMVGAEWSEFREPVVTRALRRGRTFKLVIPPPDIAVPMLHSFA